MRKKTEIQRIIFRQRDTQNGKKKSSVDAEKNFLYNNEITNDISNVNW